MESVLIAAPRDYDPDFKSRLQSFGGPEAGAEGSLVLDDGRSRVYVRRNTVALDELEPEELGQVLRLIESPVFYTVDFTDIDFGRRVIEAIADDPELVVDTDHGVLLRGSDFVRLLRSRPSWDWRQDRD